MCTTSASPFHVRRLPLPSFREACSAHETSLLAYRYERFQTLTLMSLFSNDLVLYHNHEFVSFELLELCNCTSNMLVTWHLARRLDHLWNLG